MRATRKVALAFAILLGVLLVLVAIGYFLLAGLVPKFGEAMFRDFYAPSKPEYYYISDPAFAGFFGGSCGLGRLRKLSVDPSISLRGRKRAAELILYIESGQHVPDLRKEIAEVQSRGIGTPPLYRYAQFVIWHDQARVKK
jgi:hypothetical protein